MIKFFRKIRQNLIETGKTGKYLKYAIGEIILVVIGILIALQVNNWNEKKLEENKLQTIFNIISKDLEGDILKIKEILGFYKKREPYSKHVLDGKLTANDYTDSTYFNLITYSPDISVTTRGFNLLTSTSNSKAVTDSLQISITEFYTTSISRFDFLKNYVVSDIEDNFSYWKKNFEWYPDYILRQNLDEFINYTLTNSDYKNRVANYYFVHYNVSIRFLEEFIENANYVIKELNNNYD